MYTLNLPVIRKSSMNKLKTFMPSSQLAFRVCLAPEHFFTRFIAYELPYQESPTKIVS